jgi:hypothetical protein
VANLVLILVVVLVTWYVVSFVRRRRHGLVAERGLSIGADLGMLGDAPRVRVAAVTQAGPERVRLALAREGGDEDLDLLVSLSADDFGFGLLRDWQRSQAALAIVMPPDSRIVRLRSVDDLQPLTLRRVEEG